MAKSSVNDTSFLLKIASCLNLLEIVSNHIELSHRLILSECIVIVTHTLSMAFLSFRNSMKNILSLAYC